MADMFAIWGRIKETAATCYGAGSPANIRDARAIVEKICREEHADCPPAEALDYLASEFVRLSSERRPSATLTQINIELRETEHGCRN